MEGIGEDGASNANSQLHPAVGPQRAPKRSALEKPGGHESADRESEKVSEQDHGGSGGGYADQQCGVLLDSLLGKQTGEAGHGVEQQYRSWRILTHATALRRKFMISSTESSRDWSNPSEKSTPK